MKAKTFHTAAGQDGFVLFAIVGAILFVFLVSGMFLYLAHNQTNAVRQWYASDQCLLDAQSALEQVKYEMIRAYNSNGQASLAWFQSWSSNAIGTAPSYTIPSPLIVNSTPVTVNLAGVSSFTIGGTNGVDVTLVADAVKGGSPPVRRIIEEHLRVTMAPLGDAGFSAPFLDYGFFMDHSGTLMDNIVVNGDVRVNIDFLMKTSAKVNGNVYAAGTISGAPQLWTIDQYYSKVTGRARPTNPTAPGTNGIAWPMGFDPANSTLVSGAPRVGIPFLGDMKPYRDLAASMDGKIIHNSQVVVSQIYAGPGPDKLASTADDGVLVLDGSVNPIQIQGPVVVQGDLIIKGKITGQGSIYAGRNIHIVGALRYVDPPSWPKPDQTPEQTAAANQSKDLLVLAAKGNIVAGNYTSATWYKQLSSLMNAPANVFPVEVNQSDATLGYDSDNNPGNGYRFNGLYDRYEANGGQRLSGVGSGTVPRKYYESSLADATFSALCDGDVPLVDAGLFSSHAIIGNWKSTAGFTLNGAMIGRDGYHYLTGATTLNWDIRLGTQSRDSISRSAGVPSNQGAPITYTWREIHR